MSRIGNKPVDIPSGVAVQMDGNVLKAKGPLGELSFALPPGIQAKVAEGRVVVSRPDDTKRSKSFHGLARSMIANNVLGVSKGYTKELQLQGVGFRATVQGDKLVMAIGYSSPVEFVAPQGIKLTAKEGTITISGPDKTTVGDVSAHIRSFYPPEPYKGKGIRYKGEYVRRKAGKTVA